MKKIRVFLSAILLVLILLFSLQNLNIMTVRMFTWSISLPKAIVIILTYILGMMTGGMLSSLMRDLFSATFRENKEKEQAS
ncbi:MAG: hypothetical protein RBS37_07680 [Bacteroidales bacterium]|jgi:uncharacterized integral membrane protein|nr:hypothetical protein [Bacteroidales bacterium]